MIDWYIFICQLHHWLSTPNFFNHSLPFCYHRCIAGNVSHKRVSYGTMTKPARHLNLCFQQCGCCGRISVDTYGLTLANLLKRHTGEMLNVACVKITSACSMQGVSSYSVRVPRERTTRSRVIWEAGSHTVNICCVSCCSVIRKHFSLCYLAWVDIILLCGLRRKKYKISATFQLYPTDQTRSV